MNGRYVSRALVLLLTLWTLAVMAEENTNIRVVIPVDEWFVTRGVNYPGTGREAQSVIPWGAEDARKYDFGDQAVGVDVEFEFFDSKATPALAVKNLVEQAERGATLVVGYPLSEVAVFAANAGSTYQVAQVASSASSTKLSDKHLYPYFSRLAPTSPDYARAVVGLLLHMIETEGLGWSRLAILTTSDQYGLSTAREIIAQVKDTPIEVATWQTFVPSIQNVSVQLQEIQNSDARVVVTFASNGYAVVLEEAERRGLLDDYHVFMGGPSVSGPATYRLANGTINPDTVERLRGHLGFSIKLNSEGDRFDRLLHSWRTADTAISPLWGPGTTPSIFLELSYDLGVLVFHTVVEAHRQGVLTHHRYPTAEEWTRIVRNITFEGASGCVQMDPKGDRSLPMTITNWRPEKLQWEPVGVSTLSEGVTFFPEEEIVWHDNTTNYPDLLRGPGYYYWSCDAGKKRYDETGHVVKLHKPDAGGFDDIDFDYHCDHYIDCPNLSDESKDCGANYTALFIAFGILTGLLIVTTCCCIPFVLIFGFIIPRRRVKASSPTFLIIILLSCLLGYISEYSWYGRPHPVACGFRPWLLGLAVVSMVSALSAKTWRLWRIFSKTYSKEYISDLQLLLLYAVMVIPAVVILIVWTIVSTPTAAMEKEHDNEHYVCTTGGFTGKPGGIIFFFILVGYEALVLFIAAVLCIVTRNIPSFFNESKLIAISIYNLGFLAAVVIPVVIVLQSINPFAAWIIRSVAVLYAFTATLLLQFAPKVIGVFIIDRGGDAPLPSLGKTTSIPSSSSSELSQPPSNI